MHGGVGLEGGKGQIAALGLKSDRVSNDVPQSETSLQFTVVDVPIFAQINIEQAIEHEALKMTNETGRDHRDVTLLGHDTSFNVVELQAGVVSHHCTCKAEKRPEWEKFCILTGILFSQGEHVSKFLSSVPENTHENP